MAGVNRTYDYKSMLYERMGSKKKAGDGQCQRCGKKYIIINMITGFKKEGNMSNIMKCWGERRRIRLDDKNEIDLLYLNKDCFCSTHNHAVKINKFIVVSGEVAIETEYGRKVLRQNEEFEVPPPMVHRFVALEDSVMIEIAYTTDKKIDPDDIDRRSIGGKLINGKEYTLDELKKNGMLDL